MTLSSGIFKRFKKLYVLDDDGLRRIEGALTKAAASYPEPLKVVFHVEREDDRFYETHDIDEVLSDPNVHGRRIRLLAVELRKSASLEQSKSEEKSSDRVAWVLFDKDRPPMPEPDIRIRISCQDKTWALMLADELEPQITRLFRIKKFPTWVFLLFAPIFGLVTYRLSRQFGTSLSEGLSHGFWGGTGFAGLWLALLFYSHGISEEKLWPFHILSAEPVFAWGEEVSAHSEREAIRKNILWVVVIGFFVSLVAGLATMLL